jgi:hypothetical protein
MMMLVTIAVTGPITIPKSSHLPRGTPSKPAMEIAARPGMTNTYPAKMPAPRAEAIIGSPLRSMYGAAERATGEASTTCTST